MTEYEHAVEALRPLPPDMRILALAESVQRNREAIMQQLELFAPRERT